MSPRDTTTGPEDPTVKDEPRTPEEIEAHIEQTRAALTDTVDALAAKLDVKARAGERVSEVRASLTDGEGRPTAPAWGAVATTAAVLALVVWRRSRR